MGDEDELTTMMNSFKLLFTIADHEYPQYNEEQNYFMIHRGNKTHEMIHEAWENFRAGWVARAQVDEYTVEGW
jgi:hypothetical protein